MKNSATMNDHLIKAINASLEAGKEILKIYNTNFDIELKDDNSPLTTADKNAHKVILNTLTKTPFPVLSEEGENIPYNIRKDWSSLWIVDPLDGTKEFINKNGEFTVNIALVKNSCPVLGVIYVPVSKTLYFGTTRTGAFKINNITSDQIITSKEQLDKRSVKIPVYTEKGSRPYTVVGSRSHMSEENRKLIEKIKTKRGEVEIITRGSSLKLCMVAEGLADEYPRLGPTMEWDTAAGHAIVKSAGANVYEHPNGNELKYNKKDLHNPWFWVR